MMIVAMIAIKTKRRIKKKRMRRTPATAIPTENPIKLFVKIFPEEEEEEDFDSIEEREEEEED